MLRLLTPRFRRTCARELPALVVVLLLLVLGTSDAWAQGQAPAAGGFGGGGGGFGGGGAGGSAQRGRAGRSGRGGGLSNEELLHQELSLRLSAATTEEERQVIMEEFRKLQADAHRRWETEIPTYKMFSLDQSQSQAAEQFIENILGNPEGRIRTMRLDSGFVVSGASGPQLQALQQFLADLRLPKGTMQIFKLQHARAGDLVNSLMQTVGGASYAVDERTNSLIVNGVDPQSMENVQELVKVLDQSQPTTVAAQPADAAMEGNYKLDSYWLMEIAPGAEGEFSRKVSREPGKELEPAMNELRLAGFAEVREFAHVRMNLTANRPSTAQGFAAEGHMEVQGVIKPLPSGKLMVDCGLSLENGPECRLNTSVVIQSGECFILGLNQVYPKSSNRSALVIRVVK